MPFKPSDGISTRFGQPGGNKPGRKTPDILKSLKQQFREGVDEMKIPLKDVEIREEEGVAIVKLTPVSIVQLRLNEILKKGKDADFIKLFSTLMDRFYGRPHLSIQVDEKPNQIIKFVGIDEDLPKDGQIIENEPNNQG